MYKNIYVENDVIEHPRVGRILARYPSASVVSCNRYTEIFNLKAQNFRLQKQQPALILARKHKGHVQPAPEGYSVGGDHHYYFSPMLNCLYDCRYCFLQGMYRSASHIVFVNYEDFSDAIDGIARQVAGDEEVWFFSGYDCDSLALEPVSGMAEYFIDQFGRYANAWLELRTKSTQVRALQSREPISNVVCAFSFTPDAISERIEHRVPSVDKRVVAMRRLQESGWTVGLRFDPLIFTTDYQCQYQKLFDKIFSVLDARLVHSVSIGVFRLPRAFYKTIERLYPDDAFIAQPFVDRGGEVSYPVEIESDMKNWCYQQVKQHMDEAKIYLAQSSGSNQEVKDTGTARGILTAKEQDRKSRSQPVQFEI